MISAPLPVSGWHRSLPNGKLISALGFGCSSIWASADFGDAESHALLEALLAGGVNHFDTAPSYGAGEGERRLGAFLTGRDLSQFVISTKVGSNLIDGIVERGFSPDLMEASLTQSLRRLGVNHVDILYLHGPAIADLNDTVFDFFDRLKRAGVITYSGVNSFDCAVLERVAESPIDAAMIQYNVGDFRNLPQMRALSAEGKIVMSGTAMARSKYDLTSFFPSSRKRLWYLLRLLRTEPTALWTGWRLARRMARAGQPLHETAVQFVTGQPLVLSSLFGTSSVSHARANVRAGKGALDPALWRHLAES